MLKAKSEDKPFFKISNGNPSKERAFSLLELMAVLTLLLILLSIVFPVTEHVKKQSLKLQTKLQFCSYISALEDFHSTYGTYPVFLMCTRPCNLKNCSRKFFDCLSGYSKNEAFCFHAFTPQEMKDSLLIDSFGNSEIFVLIKKPFECTIPRASFPERIQFLVPQEGLTDTIAICSVPTTNDTPVICSWE